jgi:hypothetical protein
MTGTSQIGASGVPAAILASAQATRFVLQDFVPLAESLEWQLGQRYFQQRGASAFLSDPIPVPFAINNTGVMSTLAADVFFTSVSAADAAGALEDDLFVLELGVGLGLFARYFLDAFRDRCAHHGKDYYDRLYYVLGDYSERMLLDVARHGLLTAHPGHYLLRVVDARAPDDFLPHNLCVTKGARPLFRAVFLNYVLDCLPPTFLRVEDDSIQQLHVRTCLSRGVQLHEYTDVHPEDLARLAASPDYRDREQLLQFYGLFTSEYRYFPVSLDRLPHADFLARYTRGHKGSVLYNYAALQSLERLLPLLVDDGFILINDYGYVEPTSTQELEHQRFSNATAVGLNFALLKAYFTEEEK